MLSTQLSTVLGTGNIETNNPDTLELAFCEGRKSVSKQINAKIIDCDYCYRGNMTENNW
jgi:hypothetical protein